jgi:transposase-like protein
MATPAEVVTSWVVAARPPRTLVELLARFSDDESCRRYLAQVRWPGGFACSACGGRQCWWLSDGRLSCSGCRKRISLTAGTIFADTKLPLMIWFPAAWLVTNTKNGMSALSLQRALGLRSYESSWLLLHKLRRAMVRLGRDPLSGEVEVDESYVGGPTAGARGRGTGKAIVAIAAQCRPEGKIGRIRLALVPDTSQQSLHDFCLDTIAPGSVVCTDGLPSYRGLEALGYEHQPTAITGTGSPAHVVMPRVHRVASLLKRWLLGTHQGGMQERQLRFYLDEFVFRFNRRSSRSRGHLFLRLLEQGLQTSPVTGARIVGGHQ